MQKTITLPKNITGLDKDIAVDWDALVEHIAWEEIKRTAKRRLEYAEIPGTHAGIPVYELAAYTRILSMDEPDPDIISDYLSDMGYDDDADNIREETILNILCSRYGYTDIFFDEEDELFFGYDIKELAKIILGVDKLPLKNGIEDYLNSFGSIIEETEALPKGAAFRAQSVEDRSNGCCFGTLRIELRPGLTKSKRQYYLALAYGLLVFEGQEDHALAFADAVCGKKEKGLRTGGEGKYIYLDPSWD